MFPLAIGGKAIGFLGFDSVGSTRTWSEDARMVLRLVGQTISAALENRHIRMELRKQRIFLKSVLDAIQDGISVRDTDFVVTHVNAWMERKYADRGPLTGRKCYRVFQQRDSVCPWCPAVKVLETGRPQRGVEVPYPSADSPQGCLELSAFPMRDSRGDVIGIIEHVKEISARRKAQRELERRRKFLEGVLESAPDAIVTLDDKHRIINWNRGAEELFGYTASEVRGRNIDDIITSPEVVEEAREITGRVLSGDRIGPLETVRYRRDGQPVPVLLAGSSITVDDEVIGVVGVYTDLTERKRIEARLARQRRLESLGTLAGGIAHDFNNLLSGIFGNISLARSKLPEDSPAGDYLESVERSMGRAIGLTHQLLTFAKGSDPVVEPLDTASVIRESVEFHLAGSSVKAEYDIPGDLPQVMADGRQIGEVISNLVINAKHAMPEGGRLLVTARWREDSNRAEDRGSGLVELSFKDDGVGIPERLLNRVFEPYFSTKQDGSGLGLAVVYSIVSKHGGSVDIDSSHGSGTTVTIRLPADEGAAMPGRAKDGADREESAAKSATILVMDDDEDVRDVAEGMLKAMGHSVDLAKNGSEAVEMYGRRLDEARPYDLVILDLTVPGGMGGREAASSILEMDPNALLIVSSGYSADPVLAQYRDYGFSGVLSKPYALANMRKSVAELLG
ncbi:MAG: PAS domain S-box protein [Candidatus Fermentibacteraceae bacterium]